MNLKASKRGFKKGRGVLKHLNLNHYAEFDSKISYIIYLHDYLLAYEISPVKTLTLTRR